MAHHPGFALVITRSENCCFTMFCELGIPPKYIDLNLSSLIPSLSCMARRGGFQEAPGWMTHGLSSLCSLLRAGGVRGPTIANYGCYGGFLPSDRAPTSAFPRLSPGGG